MAKEMDSAERMMITEDGGLEDDVSDYDSRGRGSRLVEVLMIVMVMGVAVNIKQLLWAL